MTHDEMVEVILAHKNGKNIQTRPKNSTEEWSMAAPDWAFHACEYRIVPEDVVRTFSVSCDGAEGVFFFAKIGKNLKLTFDGETGELKSAEVMK